MLFYMNISSHALPKPTLTTTTIIVIIIMIIMVMMMMMIIIIIIKTKVATFAAYDRMKKASVF